MRTCSGKLPAPSGGWPGCGGCATRPMACSTETDVPGALSMGQCRCLTQAAELAPEIGRDLCEDIKAASGSDSIACHVRPSSVKLSGNGRYCFHYWWRN